jgi:ornithine cyclodeaminase/alanine dehydrogenase-like protein (mu-crystallin family)
VYDTHLPTLQAYIEGFSGIVPFDVVAAESAADAVGQADVVITATGQLRETIYKTSWVKAGALVLPVHMFGWEPSILHASEKFVVDDWAQFSAYINRHGPQYTPLPTPHAEIGDIVIGRKEGRVNRTERIVNFNLGLAINDMAVAAKVLEAAQKTGAGTKLTLMREPLPFAL